MTFFYDNICERILNQDFFTPAYISSQKSQIKDKTYRDIFLQRFRKERT